LSPTAVANVQWNPLAVALKGGKIEIFDRNRRFSLKRYKIGPLLLSITKGKSYVADRSVSVPMTLRDLERRDARSPIFWQISAITPVGLPLDPDRPNFTS